MTASEIYEVLVVDALGKLPAEADAAFLNAACKQSFFLSRKWFSNLVAHGGIAQSKVRIYAIHDKRELELPLILLLQKQIGRFGIRTLSALSNWYSSMYLPVAVLESGNLPSLRLMLQRIASEAPRWHRIDLRPMDVDSPLFSDTEQAMREAGMAVQRYFCFVNWYLLVEGRSYAEYAQSLPSPLRNTLKRKGRQLERSGRAEFAIITGPDGLDAAIDAYLSVYRNSWKSPEPTPEFMPSLIRLCAHEGWLRLGVARIDGEAAAAQLWIVCNGVASIYKLAYDERHAALSLGSLLTARMMQHVIDVDRVREVDYLTGDDAYKRDWMSHSRKRYGLVGYNLRSVRGLALAATHLLGGRIRRMLRRPSGEH